MQEDQGKPVSMVRQPKADANTLLLSLGQLETELPIVTGDPTYCEGCKAVLSSISEVKTTENKATWTW